MVQDGYSYLYGPVRRGEREWCMMAIATCMVQKRRRRVVQDGYRYMYGPVRRGEGEWSKMAKLLVCYS